MMSRDSEVREAIEALRDELTTWGTTYDNGQPRSRLASSRIPRSMVLDRLDAILDRSSEAAPTPPRLETDEEAGAAYVRLTSKPHAETVELSDSINVDLDASGQAIGVELLNLAASEAAPVVGLSETLERERARNDVLRLALHRIAYSNESDLTEYARFATGVATGAIEANLEGACIGCGNALHRAEDHPEDDGDRACTRCTCSRYEVWNSAARLTQTRTLGEDTNG